MIGGRDQHRTWLFLVLLTLAAMEVGGTQGDASPLGWVGPGA